MSDEKADAVLVEVARRLVGEDRACMLGECRGNLGACFLPAAHRLLRHSGDVETGEHLTTALSRIKVEFIELADEGNAAETPDVGVRNGKIAAQNFKQAGFACAIVSHQADAIVGVDFQLFDIQDIAAGIFQKDVFSFDYEFHRLNRLLCISLLLEAQPCQKMIAHVDFSPLPNCRRERFDLAQAGKSENDSWRRIRSAMWDVSAIPRRRKGLKADA